jgi:hypothetical protein
MCISWTPVRAGLSFTRKFVLARARAKRIFSSDAANVLSALSAAADVDERTGIATGAVFSRDAVTMSVRSAAHGRSGEKSR